MEDNSWKNGIVGKYEQLETQGRGLMTTKTDLKIKNTIWDKETLYPYWLKKHKNRTVEQDDRRIRNTYGLNNIAQNTVERMKLTDETDNAHYNF